VKPITVLLADDHALVRAGIGSLLRELPDVRVVAEASDGREALELIAVRRPDVILMDVAMPGLNGLEAVSHIAQDFPSVHVIILSMHANEEYILRALRSGASGYLLKDASVTELEMAIQAAIRGETYLSPAVSQQVSEYLRRVEAGTTSLEELTRRQREVLQLIAEGYNNAEIAQLLEVSVKTVESHRMHLMNRLDIHDVAGLVRYAIRMGVVSLDG
jgi:DNA-binding NarL/FixJ family response regulator